MGLSGGNVSGSQFNSVRITLFGLSVDALLKFLTHYEMTFVDKVFEVHTFNLRLA